MYFPRKKTQQNRTKVNVVVTRINEKALRKKAKKDRFSKKKRSKEVEREDENEKNLEIQKDKIFLCIAVFLKIAAN